MVQSVELKPCCIVVGYTTKVPCRSRYHIRTAGQLQFDGFIDSLRDRDCRSQKPDFISLHGFQRKGTVYQNLKGKRFLPLHGSIG